jgi:hypothetical protein
VCAHHIHSFTHLLPLHTVLFYTAEQAMSMATNPAMQQEQPRVYSTQSLIHSHTRKLTHSQSSMSTSSLGDEHGHQSCYAAGADTCARRTDAKHRVDARRV